MDIGGGGAVVGVYTQHSEGVYKRVSSKATRVACDKLRAEGTAQQPVSYMQLHSTGTLTRQIPSQTQPLLRIECIGRCDRGWPSFRWTMRLAVRYFDLCTHTPQGSWLCRAYHLALEVRDPRAQVPWAYLSSPSPTHR